MAIRDLNKEYEDRSIVLQMASLFSYNFDLIDWSKKDGCSSYTITFSHVHQKLPTTSVERRCITNKSELELITSIKNAIPSVIYISRINKN